MVLPMPRPTKHPTTSTYYLRVRTPSDLREKAKGRTITLSIGPQKAKVRIGDAVKVSLQTKDWSEAKERFRIAEADLEKIWEGLRHGPLKLTNKQVYSFAGRFYRLFAETLEDDPGSTALWQRVKEANAFAAKGGILGTFGIGEEARARGVAKEMEKRFGPFLDHVLGEEGLEVDQDSRWRLLQAFKDAADRSADKLERNAGGDYSEDTNAARYPRWTSPVAQKDEPTSYVSIGQLFRLWQKQHEALGGAKSSVRRWQPVIDQFIAFLGHDNADKVTRADVVRWRQELIDSGKISPNTFKKTNRAALSSIFAVGVDNLLVPFNPVDGVKAPSQKRVLERPQGFTKEEAETILRAATAAETDPRHMADHTRFARRWLPWLCAYSGARMGEMAQLRKHDVYVKDGIHCIRITPEAGTVKDKEVRVVPLHPHIVEQGFVKAVSSKPAGPLFYPKKTKDEEPWGVTRDNLAKWIRKGVGVTDKRIKPNHAWRHRFKTVADAAGIEMKYQNRITGHAAANIGDYYGDNEEETLFREVAKLPRYPDAMEAPSGNATIKTDVENETA
ncbi:tyrosine-type recombinase/integrase [Roseibium aggregatum]|nr:tyrosine-type recombinase/integrase [Roseibium aggregatum]